MNLNDLTLPNSVRNSATHVIDNASNVTINRDAINDLAQKVKQRYDRGFDDVEEAFGSTNNLEDDINLVYFETAANFCFWAQDPRDKWKINGTGGWYGLRSAFARALENNIPVYDAAFMSDLTLQKASKIFLGDNDIQIPLLEQRVNNLIEAADFLINNHSGSAHVFLKSCNYNAPTIAEKITQSCVSYRDGAWYKDRWVWILKRAQILPNDLAQLSQKYPELIIKDTDKLTVFADYRLPQILRHYGVLKYSNRLSDIIDTKTLLANGSPEEIEIRAATIIACDEIAKRCNLTVADTDVSLWLISQDMRNGKNLQPHHLTISSYY